MANNSNNGINCLNEILDCNLNEISIDNSCYTVDNTSLLNNNLNTFTFMGSTNSFTEGEKINKTTSQNRANFQNISLLNCMKKCSQDSECNSIQFNYGSDGNQNEFIENGYCELYVTNNMTSGKPQPEQGQTILQI